MANTEVTKSTHANDVSDNLIISRTAYLATGVKKTTAEVKRVKTKAAHPREMSRKFVYR